MKFVLVALLVGACLTVSWPSAFRTITKSKPIEVRRGQTFDGFRENGNKWFRYDRGRKALGDCRNVEGERDDAVFILYSRATLKNVILGGNAVEHVHCVEDGCTVENVYWEDVCNTALTFENGESTTARYYVKGGAARYGQNKIIQHKSAGTVYISNFYCEYSDKLYSACGNCKKGYQGKRDVVMTDVSAKMVAAIAVYNSNFGDTVTLNNVTIRGGHVCRAYQGRNDGIEPTALGYKCDVAGTIKSCVCK